MHEQGIAEDLVARAAQVVGDDAVPAVLRLRIGPLAAVTPSGLSAAVTEKARSQWGRVPRLEIEMSDDLGDGRATGVVLSSVIGEG